MVNVGRMKWVATTAGVACAALAAASEDTGLLTLHGEHPEVLEKLEELDETIKRTRASPVKAEHDLRDWIGTHYIFELMNISNRELATNAELLEETMLAASRAGGLSILSSSSHQFTGKGEGATAFVILAESHFSVHTWPELKYVAVDIFTCGDELKAKTTAAFLSTSFGAETFLGARLPRGIPDQLTLNQLVMSPAAIVEEKENAAESNKDIGPTLAEQWADSLSKADMSTLFSNSQADFDVIESVRSKYQHVEFIKNKETGDVCLVLDNTVQICESYNYQYSEMYVHLPAAYLNKLETVLIIGGGDALALREVLKYKSVKRVVQLELDEAVPKLSAKHFGIKAHLPGEPDADPRVEWRFGDAAKTIVDLVHAGERFDLLLLDISETDPSGTVSTEDFFRQVATALAPRGIFIKNENYQQATAALFDEYLEVIYPVPMITQQVFVMGSNGTSLLLPHFSLFDQNDIQTSFLVRAPSDRFRQLRSIVRRYSKRGLNYEQAATNAFEERYHHSPFIRPEEHDEQMRETIDGGECVDPELQPCYMDGLADAQIVLARHWRKLCVIRPAEDLQIEFANQAPVPVSIYWLGDGGAESVVFEEVKPGFSRRINTFIGHTFIIRDTEHELVKLADFTVAAQLITHPFVTFRGLHEEVVSSRRDVPSDVKASLPKYAPKPSE